MLKARRQRFMRYLQKMEQILISSLQESQKVFLVSFIELEKAITQTNKQEDPTKGQQGVSQSKKNSIVGEKKEEVIVLNKQN